MLCFSLDIRSMDTIGNLKFALCIDVPSFEKDDIFVGLSFEKSTR
jgi:hypothetical protein